MVDPSVPADERDLIRRSAAGDVDAFERLVEAHQDRIYNLTYRLTGNPEDAADAAQEALLRAYQGLRGFRGDAQFSTWLHRIATNTALDLLRRRPQGSGDLPPDLAAPDDPDREARRREVHRRVHAAVGQLPAEYRTVVVLRDFQGLAYDQIADVLQIPIGTVRSRLSRARDALRGLLVDLVTAEG